MSRTIKHKRAVLNCAFYQILYNFFAMVFFAAAIGKFVVTAGPQVFVFNGLCMGCVGVFRQFFNNFGRYACYQGVRRNNGVFGYNRAGCHNGAFADNSAVQYGGVHADKHMVFNRAGMQKSAVAYGYIVAQNAVMAGGNVQHAVFLNIGISATFDFLNLAADGYVLP